MPTPISFRCPECGDDIGTSCLNYSESARNYGSADLGICERNGQVHVTGHNYDGTEDDDGYTDYSCPECGDVIEPFNCVPTWDEGDEEEGDPSGDLNLVEGNLRTERPVKPKDPTMDVPTICADCNDWFIASDLRDHIKRKGSQTYYCEMCLNKN